VRLGFGNLDRVQAGHSDWTTPELHVPLPRNHLRLVWPQGDLRLCDREAVGSSRRPAICRSCPNAMPSHTYVRAPISLDM
jgi:hypothetical protein